MHNIVQLDSLIPIYVSFAPILICFNSLPEVIKEVSVVLFWTFTKNFQLRNLYLGQICSASLKKKNVKVT